MKLIAVLTALAGLLGTGCFAFYDYSVENDNLLASREAVLSEFISAVEAGDLDAARLRVFDRKAWNLDTSKLIAIRKRLDEMDGAGFDGVWIWRGKVIDDQMTGRPEVPNDGASLTVWMIRGSEGWAILRVALD